MNKKTIAGILGGTTLLTGGALALDAQVNPYTETTDHYELAVENDSVKISKTEPRIGLSRWNNEEEVVIRPDLPVVFGTADKKMNPNRPLLSDRLEYTSGKMKAFVKPKNDTEFDIDFELTGVPDTNVFSYTIEGYEDLDFFYQPELTQNEIDGGAIRPDNVIGSYAVYHKTKKNHVEGYTNYATGKLMHIYRPKAVDARGNEIWGALAYADGKLTVTIDSTWLKEATYPVVVDPTFGYTSQGASSYGFVSATSNNPAGILGTLSETGYITSMSMYISYTVNPKSVMGRIYNGSAGSLGSLIATTIASDTTSLTITLESRNFSTVQGATANTYWLEVIGNEEGPGTGDASIAYDTGGATDTGYTKNDFGIPTYNTNRYSIYATYSPPPKATFQIQ